MEYFIQIIKKKYYKDVSKEKKGTWQTPERG
jgi:hypothetical protein